MDSQRNLRRPTQIKKVSLAELMEKSKRVPHVPVTVDENQILEGALNVLKSVRPDWDRDNISFKLLTDGITNKLVACKLKEGDDSDTVLVRVYGNKTDLLIDRKAETRNILLLNNVGLAPELYATFDNGLAYEFVPGSILSGETVILPHIYRTIAKRMAMLHKVTVPGCDTHEPCMWTKLQSFLDLVPDVFADSKKQSRFEELDIPKSKIQEELDFLKEILSKLDSPVVFCHNDLLLANVIYTKDRNSVTFIDYEYAAFNYQAFDIGNHFAEFAGVGEVDYTRYPNEELQKDWLRAYLEEYKEEDISEKDVEKLYVQVNQFALASHVFWGIWALIQAEHSYIDFDFLEYAAIRLKEYFEKKETFLSMIPPS